MGSLLKKILNLVLHGSLKKILFGAGLSLVSAGISFTVVNYYINKLINHLQSLGGGSSLIALFGIVGLDIALSIIIGAYVVKFTIKKTQVFLGKK